MTIYLRLSMVFLFIAACFSVQAAKIEIWSKENLKQVILYQLDCGEWKKLQQWEIKTGEKYTHQIENQSGMFIIQCKSMIDYFYLLPGQSANIETSQEGSKMQQPDPFNRQLMACREILSPVIKLSREFYHSPTALVSDTTNFFRTMEKVKKDAQNFLNTTAETITKPEQEMLKLIAVNELNYARMAYLQTPITSNRFKKLPAGYEDLLQNTLFTKKEMLNYYPHALTYVSCYLRFIKDFSPNKKAQGLELITSNEIKAAYLLEQASRYDKYSKLVGLKNNYGTLFTSEPFAERLKKLEDKLGGLAVGAMAYNFKLPDVNDNIITMDSLKGKVVVVDLWATWCGPCKREIPHFKKLRESFDQKNVIFVGISIDTESMKKRWKELAQTIGGIQLLDVNKTVGNYYGATSIPRFMVFDRQGKIISTDAPAPSTPGLKKMIENALRNPK